MHKKSYILGSIVLAMLLWFLPHTHATTITLAPATTDITVGDTVAIDILAEIDPDDAIIGFGFDLTLSGSGALTFNGFTANSLLFADDPGLTLLSDADGIRGASGGDLFFGPPVSGQDIRLGTLSFLASGVGDVAVSLGADDLDVFFTEGLIPADITLPNFLPTVMAAQVHVDETPTPMPNPVPEPGTWMLLGTGLVGLIGYSWRRKQQAA